MNKISNFLRIPLVKIVCILVILYFALFSETNNPNSLGNRLSKEEISKNLREAKEKSRFIVSTVNTARDLSKNKVSQPDVAAKISIEEIDSGGGDLEVSCGSEVEISYGIYDAHNKQIKSVSSEKLVIGSNLNEIVEKNISSMKQGGIRNIRIPRNFKTHNNSINDMLKFYDSDIRYQISLISLKAPISGSSISCQ